MFELYVNFFKAGIAVIFLLLVDFVLEFLLIRKVKDKKRSFKLRVSLRYILFFCFLFFVAKMWMEGFGYLLTFVGVISAAFTITQKEYIMNFVGWLIIMWRDLFVEGDYIEIGKYKGYVSSIGTLYFFIEEASDLSWGDKTGRMVKIPNSLVANTPIVNFALDRGLVEGRVSFIFTLESSLEAIRQLIPLLEVEIEELSLSHRRCQFLLRVHQDRPSGVQLKIRYLSLKQHQKAIEDKVFDIVMEAVNRPASALKLSVAL